MPEPDIRPAAPEERGALANLFQLYVHDFSELWAGTDEGELEPDGRFAEYGPLELYWREPGRIPFLVRLEGRLAGFALINAKGHVGPVDYNVAEFFIVRKHRRTGLGASVARAIFTRHPGQWEVAVVRRNTAALAFWRQAIGGCPGVQHLEELDLAGADWNGPVFRFRVA